MDRRSFIGTLAAGLLAAPRAVAQEYKAGRVYRLGFLSPGGPSPGFLILIEGLRELGYVEGQNLVVERRYAGGKTDRLPGLARELVRIPVDVIVAVASAVDAAKDATKTIPIVMGVASDPVGRGFVPSLARPGGNITGSPIRWGRR